MCSTVELLHCFGCLLLTLLFCSVVVDADGELPAIILEQHDIFVDVHHSEQFDRAGFGALDVEAHVSRIPPDPGGDVETLEVTRLCYTNVAAPGEALGVDDRNHGIHVLVPVHDPSIPGS